MHISISNKASMRRYLHLTFCIIYQLLFLCTNHIFIWNKPMHCNVKGPFALLFSKHCTKTSKNMYLDIQILCPRVQTLVFWCSEFLRQTRDIPSTSTRRVRAELWQRLYSFSGVESSGHCTEITLVKVLKFIDLIYTRYIVYTILNWSTKLTNKQYQQQQAEGLATYSF